MNFPLSETWKQIHNDILSNYLKTFNYKLTWNLLPVKLKPHIAAYHQTNMCSFCNFSEETVSHLFITCVKLNSVWDFIIHLIFKLTGYTIPKMTSDFFLFFDFSFLSISHCQKQIDAIVFLLSITKHSIWTHRNQIVHEGIAINSDCTIKKIASMIIFRHREEKYRKRQKYNVSIKALCN